MTLAKMPNRSVQTDSERLSACPVCHETFGIRKGKKYCSDHCRMKAWKRDHFIQLYDKHGKWIGQIHIKGRDD